MDYKEYNMLTAAGAPLRSDSEVQLFMNYAADEAQKITAKINGSYHTQEELRALVSELVGYEVPETFRLFPPIYSDYGKNITLGENVFINSGCCFQDQGGIAIGDGCLIGHQVVIATLNHDPSPETRASMTPKKVTLGKNVWVGSHATILPGVSVGDGSIIAAGAVVTKDVPPGCVAAGVPARVIKRL